MGQGCFKELIPIGSTRCKPRKGDVFVVQPEGGRYLYGLAVRDDVQLIIRTRLIYIYNRVTSVPVMPDDPLRPDELLILPQMVNDQGWARGYFYTIGNIDLTEDYLSSEYGFKIVRTGQIVEKTADRLNTTPLWWQSMMLATMRQQEC